MLVHTWPRSWCSHCFGGMLHQNLPDTGAGVLIVLEECYIRTYLIQKLVFSLFWKNVTSEPTWSLIWCCHGFWGMLHQYIPDLGASVVMVLERMLHQNLPDPGAGVVTVFMECYVTTHLILEPGVVMVFKECYVTTHLILELVLSWFLRNVTSLLTWSWSWCCHGFWDAELRRAFINTVSRINILSVIYKDKKIDSLMNWKLLLEWNNSTGTILMGRCIENNEIVELFECRKTNREILNYWTDHSQRLFTPLNSLSAVVSIMFRLHSVWFMCLVHILDPTV